MRNTVLKRPFLRRRDRTAPRTGGTTFQAFWHGPPLGTINRACLRTFVRHGHTVELFVYDPIEVPGGVVLRDASVVIPRDELFYFDNDITGEQDLGPFSDLFRFKLLHDRGGWWCDVDTVCLSDSFPHGQRAWARENPEASPAAVGTSQLAMHRGDPVAHRLYEDCLALSRTGFGRREALGPHLITETIRAMELPTDVFGSTDTFYPIRWIEMFKLWLPQYRDEVDERLRHALFMPIYQSFPKYTGLSMQRRPPDGSYLAELCRGEDDEGSTPYDAETVLTATRKYFERNATWAVPELCAVSGERDLRLLGLD